MFSNHVYSKLWYHFVWSTKKQMPWITKPLRNPLHEYISATIKRKGWVPLEIGGTQNHVHILMQCGPMDSIPTLVSNIKSNSSRYYDVR